MKTGRAILLGSVVLLLLLTLAGNHARLLMEILSTLPVGWLRFLARTLPRVTLNWNLIGMAAVCLALIIAGIHYFCRWLQASIQPEQPAAARWGVASSAGLAGCFLLLFFIGMAVIGIVHQTAWMVSSPQPLYTERVQFIIELKMTEGAFEQALLELTSSNAPFSLPALRQSIGGFQPSGFRDKVEIFLVMGDNGYPQGMIGFARDPVKRSQILVSTRETNCFRPAAEWPEWQQRYGSRLQSF